MTTLDERFLQLKGEIEESKIIQNQKEEILTKKVEMYDLANEFEPSLKNDLLKNKALNEFVNAVFEYLRVSNDIVHKISEKASNEFEDKINEHQQKLSNSFELLNETVRKYYEVKIKLEELESRDIKTLTLDDLTPLKNDADKNSLELKKGRALTLEYTNELKDTISKISFMTDGFDSLMNFLDGNRS